MHTLSGDSPDPRTPVTSAPIAGWYPDPSRRFQLRYWDGRAWSQHVSSWGAMSTDPPRPTATAYPAAPAYPVAPAPAADLPEASPGQRFASFGLDLVLMAATLVVGWLIWSCFTFPRGQSPAKSLLGQRVVRQDTGQAAPWSDMFLRNVILQFGLTLLSIPFLGLPLLVGGGLVLSGDGRQTAWDRLAGTRVVVDPGGLSVPVARPYGY